MKKQKGYLLICMIAASMILTGCGPQLYELTKEEEELIIHSAAYYVAKHNIRQKDGISAVVDPDSIVLEVETEAIGEGAVSGEENVDGVDEAPEVSAAKTLAKVIGHENDLLVTYNGSVSASNYIEGEAYSIDAQNGKTFYIMQFTVINPSDADVLLDNVTLNPAFKLVSGDINVKAEVTFLTTDFSTYLGTIPAGESVETVLLFEVMETQVEQIVEPSLQITVNNETETIKL